MPLLRSVHYRTPLHPEHPRKHAIPLDAARELTGEPTALPSCLADHPVLARISVVAGNQVLFTTREVVLTPRGENQVSLPAELFRDAPPLPDDAFLVVLLVLLTGPSSREPRSEV